MTSVPFIAFYPSDWRGGVSVLTDFEELVYLKICLAIWDDGKPVHEDDVPRLFRRAPDEGEVKAACASLVRLRKLKRGEDGLLTNPRAVKAYKDAIARSKAGRKGAASRWKNKRKRENATALPPDSDRTATAERGQCQPEPELEPEEEGTPPPVSPPTSSRGTRLAPDWTPCDAAIAFAAETGLTDDAIRHTADRFRDYWIAQPGQKGVKRDWLATWRNWVRRDTAGGGAEQPPRNGAGGRRTQREIKTELAGAIARRVGERRQPPPGADRGEPGGDRALAAPAVPYREPVG